jgi:hypothetical protein
MLWGATGLPTDVRCTATPPSLEYEERQERIVEQQMKGKVVGEGKYPLL